MVEVRKMSDKRKLSTILGICGATVLAGGGSAFLTNTGLTLLDKDQQVVQESEAGPIEGETEEPITVEQFSSTKDSFVIVAKKTLSEEQGEGDESSASGAGNDRNSTTSDNTMYATGNVNVRSDANADSEIMGTLSVGEGVAVTGNENDGWIEVTYNGQTGYISGNYLSGDSSASGSSGGSSSQGGSSAGGTSQNGSSASGGSQNGSTGGSSSGSSGSGDSQGSGSSENNTPAVIPTAGTMYATEGVNVRSGPSSDNRVLGAIEGGTGISITGGEYNGWIEVVYNGQVGYIYNTYLVWDPDDIYQGGTSDTGSQGTDYPQNNAWDDSYLMSDSGSRYISEDELDGWTATDLSYLRNEIFARHGREFTSEEYRDYFSQKTWYNPEYSASYFDENMDSYLNDYEWANLDLIQRLEDERS